MLFISCGSELEEVRASGIYELLLWLMHVNRNGSLLDALLSRGPDWSTWNEGYVKTRSSQRSKLCVPMPK
jgi:hypothetical protein